MTKGKALQMALDALMDSVDGVVEEHYDAVQLYSNYPSRQVRIEILKKQVDDHQAAITACEEALAQEPAVWAISYDGITPYTLWHYGDGALLDTEIKRIGGTACKMPLYKGE